MSLVTITQALLPRSDLSPCRLMQNSLSTPRSGRDGDKSMNPYLKMPMAPRRRREFPANLPCKRSFRPISPTDDQEQRIPERLILDLDDCQTHNNHKDGFPKLVRGLVTNRTSGDKKRQKTSSVEVPVLRHVPLIQMRQKKNHKKRLDRSRAFGSDFQISEISSNTMHTPAGGNLSESGRISRKCVRRERPWRLQLQDK